MSEKEQKEKEAADKKQTPEIKDNIIQTQHSVTINGEEINYTATTGTIVLKEEADKEGPQPKIEIFFVAYTKNDVAAADRPLTFSFNGGPGSSSIWLHLGILGPQRVPVNEIDSTKQLKPPYTLVDNEFSLLTDSDLVFIDPTGTGYSRAVKGEEAAQFYNFKRDIETVGAFIRLYTSRYKRWSSAKFLIGESYGTTRAAGLSAYLQMRYGLFLNGIMLVSSILQFQTARFEPGNDLPYPLFLPTFAATAWYHQKVAPAYQAMSLEDFVKEVSDFAETEYATALMLGTKLSTERRADVAQMLSAYTGLSPEYIERTNLRVNIMRFAKELLREEGMTVGRFDSRVTGRDKDDAGESFEYDPSFPIVMGVYAACFNDYVRDQLEFETDLPYEVLSMNVFPQWKYNSFQNSYVNTAETLRQAMSQNHHLKVLVANGYYDMATPFFATEYTFSHLGIKPELEENVSMTYYEAGHMMYFHKPSLEKLGNDLRQFVRDTLA